MGFHARSSNKNHRLLNYTLDIILIKLIYIACQTNQLEKFGGYPKRVIITRSYYPYLAIVYPIIPLTILNSMETPRISHDLTLFLSALSHLSSVQLVFLLVGLTRVLH